MTRSPETVRTASETEQLKDGFTTFLESAPDAVVVVASDGRIVLVNQLAEKMFGYDRHELEGRTVESLVPDRYRDLHSRHRGVYAQHPKTRPMGIGQDLLGRRKDNSEFPVEISLSPLQTDKGPLVISIIRDISARKQAEELIQTALREKETLLQELQQRTAELKAANKELEAFSYSVSHDLRAPLRGIDGYVRMLQEDYADQLDEEGNRMLGVVSGEAQRMGRLIDDLLAFSRLGRQQMEMREIDVTTVARAVYEKLIAAAPNPVPRLEMKPLPPAQADAAMLRQVFSNLLANAIKFTRHQPEPLIEVEGWSDAGESTYCVKDNGVGFDEKYKHKLFCVFQRLHSEEEFEGTGVGLALVQRIIHRHGGRVWAESQNHRGAKFCFTLPKLKEPVHEPSI